jgi:hypothetical protein
MYKSRLKKGITKFNNGVSIDWSNATQKEMKSVYEMGNNDLVTKEEDAKPKKTKAKAKEESSKDNSDKE